MSFITDCKNQRNIELTSLLSAIPLCGGEIRPSKLRAPKNFTIVVVVTQYQSDES